MLAHELPTWCSRRRGTIGSDQPQPAGPTEEAGEPEIRRGYLRNKAEKYARNVPGYRLICVIIGRSRSPEIAWSATPSTCSAR